VSPALAFVVIEIFVLVFVLEVVVLVVLKVVILVVIVNVFILVFVFGLLLFLFVVELFIERLTGAVAGLLSARRADAILNRCAARTAGGASTRITHWYYL
jgi:hypothetical protein